MCAASSEPYRISHHRLARTSLRQGEVLSNIILFRRHPDTLGTREVGYFDEIRPFAVIVSQDCDLDQDHAVRFSEPRASDKLIPTVLLCVAVPAEELFHPIIAVHGKKSKEWDRIRQNNNPRYHFLQQVEPPCDRLNEGLPELTIDFKKYFAVPTDELYRRIDIGEAQRRCVLVSPYLEHLSSRFAAFLSRVALPEAHFSEPERMSAQSP